jgi:DHA3 family tetracycline resistance protein-like MFS transporter
MVRARPSLMSILGIGLFYGLYSEGFDRLWTPFILSFETPSATLDGLTPVAWFGIIRIGAILLGIAGIEIAQRRVKMDDETSVRRAMFLLSALMVASLFAFSVAFHFSIAVAAYWIFSTLRQIKNPLYTAWVNQKLDPQVRATVVSMSSQVDAFGQIIGGPPVGLIGSLVSLRAALATSALILAPVLALFARASRRTNL